MTGRFRAFFLIPGLAGALLLPTLTGQSIFKFRKVHVAGLDGTVVPALAPLFPKDGLPALILFPHGQAFPRGVPRLNILRSGPGFEWWNHPDPVRFPIPGGNAHFAFGDFNEDGRLDIVLLGDQPGDSSSAPGPQVLLNLEGRWSRSGLPEDVVFASPVVAADLDSDGHLDFAFLRKEDTLVPWWGNGRGEFQRGKPRKMEEPWQRICVKKDSGHEPTEIVLLHRDRDRAVFLRNAGPGRHLIEGMKTRTVASFLLQEADREAFDSLNMPNYYDPIGQTRFSPFLKAWKSLGPDRVPPQGPDGEPLQGPFFMQKGDLDLDGHDEILFGWGRFDQLSRLEIVSRSVDAWCSVFVDLSDELLFPYATLADCDADGDLDLVAVSFSLKESSSRVVFGENRRRSPKGE